MRHRSARTITGILAILAGCSALYAVDPPDLRLNELSGRIEAVDATWSGTNYNVRYTVVNGAGQQSTSMLLSTNPSNDLDPRIVLSSAGDACVAWWRDTSPTAIVYRKHAFSSGVWGPEYPIGLSSERNSRPRLTYSGDKLWAGYQIQNPKSRNIAAQIIDDDPEPCRTIIASTSNMGDLDMRLLAEGGHLWITWIDVSSQVGYSEYAYGKGLWALPSYESYEFDSADQAQQRIRTRILGN